MTSVLKYTINVSSVTIQKIPFMSQICIYVFVHLIGVSLNCIVYFVSITVNDGNTVQFYYDCPFDK